jgi:carbamoylphosphate synthase large subunit
VRVLVTAVGGGVGQAVLRALRGSTLPLTVVGTDATPWSTGLYTADKGYLVPGAGAKEAYRSRILEICRAEGIEVLIPGSDPELGPLAELVGDLEALGCRTIVASPACIRVCRDKLETYTFFAKRGLPFVETVAFADRERLIRAKGYPLVVKPAGGSASVNVQVVAGDEGWGPEQDYRGFIVQEYLVPRAWGKTKAELVSADVYARGQLKQEDEISIQFILGPEQEILGMFTSVNGLRSGVPINVWPQAVPEAEAAAREMALALAEQGLIGPCNFQCKLTEKGPVFFEVNPRFTGITGVRAGMGFNECEAMIRLLRGEGVAAVRRHLIFQPELMSVRYVTDSVIPKADFQRLVAEGAVEGSGRSLCL